MLKSTQTIFVGITYHIHYNIISLRLWESTSTGAAFKKSNAIPFPDHWPVDKWLFWVWILVSFTLAKLVPGLNSHFHHCFLHNMRRNTHKVIFSKSCDNAHFFWLFAKIWVTRLFTNLPSEPRWTFTHKFTKGNIVLLTQGSGSQPTMATEQRSPVKPERHSQEWVEFPSTHIAVPI